MVSERQRIESAPPTVANSHIPPTYEFNVNGGRTMQASSLDRSVEKAMYFLAEVSCIFLLIINMQKNDMLHCLDVWHSESSNLPLIYLQAMHAFEAESEGELSLAVGDYVVVRQVWSHAHVTGYIVLKI
jgi:hypothetical protein